MSLVGTSLGRMAYGAGQIANKYIDQEIDTQKAQAIADIQRQSAMQMDQYTNSPERRAAMREAAGQDTIAQGAAARQVEVTNALDDRGNTSLNAAAAARAGAVARAGAENQAHDVAPGGEVIIGAGKNTAKTPGQWNYEAYAEGLKGAKGQDRDRVIEAHLSGINAEIKTWQDHIAKGMADGTISPKPPADGKNTDAYDRFQAMQSNIDRLQQARAAVIASTRERDVRVPALDATPAVAPPVQPDQPGAADARMGARSTGTAATTPAATTPAASIQSPAALAAQLQSDAASGGLMGRAEQRSGSVATDQVRQRRIEEASKITADQIQQMSPKEAAKVYSDYGDVLDPVLARMLRKKI
jgi:hypothetical protein